MSNLDIESVFQPTSSSVLDFLREPGQCFYIPSYQRPYSWGKTNVERLFSDVVTGLNKILFSTEALTFIGTIICIHDTNYKSINPIFRQQVPGRVMTVIDGQQRLTSIILLNTILHDEISKRLKKFENKAEEHFTWLFDHCCETVAELESTIWENRNKGDKLYRYYPKIIRAIDDKWSTREVEAEYLSPIGRYLSDYIKHVRLEKTGTFSFNPKDETDRPIAKYSVLVENRKLMVRHIKKIISGDYSDFPKPLKILSAKKLSEMILSHETPDTTLTYLGGGSTDKLYSSYLELIRLLLFTNYLNRNVAVTVVTTKEEDYAFDMFEALNTTGEPLSAFETFKPKIVEAESEKEYENSPSFGYVETIENYLTQFKTANERQNATSNLLIPFALAEDGGKIGKKLNDQRFYLRASFEKLARGKSPTTILDERRNFLKHMSDIAYFLKNCWPADAQEKPVIPNSSVDVDDQALVCLDLLRQLNHTIVISILSAFLSKALASEDNDKENVYKEFYSAIKAVTAFSVVWRSIEFGTRGIDNHYRTIMKEGLKSQKIPGFCRSVRGGNFTSITLHSLQEILRSLLNDAGVHDEKSWVSKIENRPIYSMAKPALARFLLLLSYNNTLIDNKNLPLLQQARSGKFDILNYKSWKSEEMGTVEHVAPQAGVGKWDDNLYEDEFTIHTLGNLALLPLVENNIVGNQCWENKRLYFKIFASETDDEFNKRKKEATKKGIIFSRRKQDILDASQYLNTVKPIAEFKGKWNRDLIVNRSHNVAKLSWRYLSTWLGY